jgi:excinuclease ABC subunit C
MGTLAAAIGGEKPGDKEDLEAAAELQRVLGLRHPPRTIEAYDISTIQGTSSVGAKVRFENGRPDRSGYRRFRIRSVRGQDDFAMMGEVVSRRLRHIGEDPLPDLLLIDGGRGQLGAALEAIKRAGVEVPVASLAKREEEVFVPGIEGPVPIPADSPAKLLLMRVRDEAHRFAVGYHRNVRARGQTASALDGIRGLGEKKAAALLRRFSSVKGIRAASEDELRQVEGIGPNLAKRISEALR